MKFPSSRVLSCLTLAVLAAASAQTSSKQNDFDAIVARASDAKSPQSADLNQKQLDAWAAKYHVKMQTKVLAGKGVGGHGVEGPIASPEMLCEKVIKVGRLRCVLVAATTGGDGKGECHYNCS